MEKIVKDCTDCPFNWSDEFGHGCTVQWKHTDEFNYTSELMGNCPLLKCDGILVKLNKANIIKSLPITK